MYYVYVLKSESLSKTYVGHTEDLEARIQQHQSHFQKTVTGDFDWKVAYLERYPSRSLAMKREKYFKTGDGRKVLKLKGIL